MLTMRDVEDIAIIRNLRAAREAREAAREEQGMQDELDQAYLTIQDKDRQIAKLRRDLIGAVNRANANNDMARATTLVAKHFRLEFSKVTGAAEGDTKVLAQKLLRKAFDRYVDESIQGGLITSDPRKSGDLVDWYSNLP